MDEFTRTFKTALASFIDQELTFTLSINGDARYRRGKLVKMGEDFIIIDMYTPSYMIIGKTKFMRKRNSSSHIRIGDIIAFDVIRHDDMEEVL